MTGKRGAISCFVIALVLATLGLNAQPNGQTDREEMYRRYLEFPKYVKGGKVEAHWMADGNSFWYAEGAPANTVLWEVDPVANTKEPLFDTNRLRNVLESELGYRPPYEGVPFSLFRFIEAKEQAVRFTVEDQDFELGLDTYEIKRVPPESEADRRRRTPQVIRKAYDDYPDLYEVPSPDGKWFVGLKDHNLYLRSPLDDGITWLTTGGIQDYEWGDLPWRFQPVWSPDSLKLAVLRGDFRNVPRIPIVRYLKPTEEVDWVPYPYKAGTPIERQELYLIDILSKRQLQIETGKGPYEQIGSVGWLPGTGRSSSLLRTIATSGASVCPLLIRRLVPHVRSFPSPLRPLRRAGWRLWSMMASSSFGYRVETDGTISIFMASMVRLSEDSPKELSR